VLQRLREHPVADARRQAGVLDQRQELHRRDQPLLRVVPAQQGLEAQHAAVAHVDLGLVVQHELGCWSSASCTRPMAITRSSVRRRCSGSKKR
jgi:hypothetical protein